MILATSLFEKLNITNDAYIILVVSLMLFLGFAGTRITKLLKLPNVTAYIVVGILIGPCVLNIIPKSFAESSSFLADIALAFIAFSTGEYFRINDLKKSGLKIIIITLFEAVLSSVLVFILTRYILKLDSLPFCIVLSALASATAPASTLMTIRQTGARGPFVNALLQVIAIGNIIAFMAYSISIEIAKVSTLGGTFNFIEVLKSLGINIGIMALGSIFGILLKLLMPKKRTVDNRLIIGIATLFLFCGICVPLGQSPLLGCMTMGMVYINISNDEKLFRQFNYWSPPILVLFFVRSGINFDMKALFVSESIGKTSLILVSILYMVVRTIGKYFGTFFGAIITKSPKTIRNYLGFALIPQAGVAIGLAALGAREIDGVIGKSLNTIILFASILYELVGPALTKMALSFSGAIPKNIEDVSDVSITDTQGNKKSEVEILIERIKDIKSKMPDFEDENIEEKAFEEGAQDYINYNNYNRPGFNNRRR